VVASRHPGLGAAIGVASHPDASLTHSTMIPILLGSEIPGVPLIPAVGEARVRDRGNTPLTGEAKL
jgi:hypothetical protein